MVASMQEPQSYEDDAGNVYVREGNRWRVIRGGQAQAPAAGPALPPNMVQMQTPAEDRAQRAERRQEEQFDWQREAESRRLALAEETAGIRGNRYQNKFDEARATRDATRFGEAMEGWSGASALESAGQRARRVLEDGAPVGAFADQRIAAGRIAGDFLGFLPGIPNRRETEQLEQLRLLGSQGALGDVSKLKGPLSEKELAFIQRLQIDPNATAATNLQVADAMRWAARRQTEYGSSMQRWVQEYGSPSATNPQGQSFDGWWGQWSADNLPPPGSNPQTDLRIRDLLPDETPEALAASGRVRGSDGVWRYPRDEQGNPIFPEDTGGSPPDGGGASGVDGSARPGSGGEARPASGGYETALAQERANADLVSRAGGGVDMGLQFTGPFNDELAYAEGFLRQGVGNIGRRLAGRDIEVSAAERGRASQNVMRQDQERFGRERPAQNIAANLLGATAFGPAGGAAAPSLLRMAGQGVVEGGIYGGAASERPALERGGDVLQGAALGGVLAPVASVVARPVINNVLAPVGRSIARPIAALGESMGVPGAADMSRRLAPNVLEGAVDRYGARFNPDAGVLTQRADERAAQGLETTFVDLMDEGQRGLGRALATRQTPARQVVREFAEGRAENLPDRMAMQARRTMSNDPRSPAEIRDQLAASGRREAAPLYEAAYAEPFTPTPVIEDILSRPAGRAALERAARIAANEGRDPNSIGLIVSDAGPVAVRSPTMQTMDYVKRGLDDVLEGYRDRTTGRMTLDTEGRAIEGLRREFRDELDQINPAYGAARAAHADTAALQRATELGETFLSMEADEFSRQASLLNPAEREVAVAAARRAVERGAGTQGAAPGVAQRLASGREQNMRNAALLENPIPMQDAMRAEREGVMAARSINPGAGSPTAPALSDQAQAGLSVASAVGSAMNGNLRGSVGALGRLVRLGYSDQEANALMTAAIDPNRTREVIDMLATRMNRREARNMLRAIRFSASRGAGEYAGDDE
jgi:hypothetical protein